MGITIMTTTTAAAVGSIITQMGKAAAVVMNTTTRMGMTAAVVTSITMRMARGTITIPGRNPMGMTTLTRRKALCR